MAILKHKTNKNMNYGDALDYLLFQHDEYTMKPILDEQGRKQLRDEYYIDGINCEPMFFEKECEMVNKKYHKNYRYDEIKSHHYVLSFDPSDKTERGLTGERAQQLGLEFARKNFPGHQMLVVTHTDGHNHSGNIHVHIVLNSVRKETVAEEDFMERPCDHKAGYKHHQTRALLTHLQKSLMELCEREKLHQIDLLSPSASKITQEEYWAQRRGQKNLNEINKQIIEDGYIPTQTNFQTQKQKIRDAVDELAAVSKSFEDFQSQLFEKYKITVIEKRGRFSYHLPEREKNISERSLGNHYGKGQRAKSALNAVSAELKVTNMQLKHLGRYYANRRIHNQMTKSLNKKKFRQQHQKELAAYKESKDWLEGQFPEGTFPAVKELQTKKESLENRKETLQINYKYYRDYEKDLKTVTFNVDEVLGLDAERHPSKQPEVLLS